MIMRWSDIESYVLEDDALMSVLDMYRVLWNACIYVLYIKVQEAVLLNIMIFWQ